LAAIAQPSKLPTLIIFPDHILSLPMESWGTKEKMIQYNEPEFGLMTSIYFPEDDEITDYVKWVFPEHYEEMAKESPLGIPIGFIYMTVYNDLQQLEQAVYDPNLVLMEFGTTGTSMSLLFSNSRSIRRCFVDLLVKYKGVCGVFNMEMSTQVFWLKGREVEEEISDPWMPPNKIEEILNSEHGEFPKI